VARGPIKAIRRSTRRGAYKLVHAVLPESTRARLRRMVRGAEAEERRAAENAARKREKELRVELKQKARAARRSAKSRPRAP
jgi:hypothetical protein